MTQKLLKKTKNICPMLGYFQNVLNDEWFLLFKSYILSELSMFSTCSHSSYIRCTLNLVAVSVLIFIEAQEKKLQ